MGTELDICSTYNTDNTTDRNLYIFNIFDYTNSATYKVGSSIFYKVGDNGTDNNFGFFGSLYAQTTAVSSILLANSTGNFTSGTVLLYGVK